MPPKAAPKKKAANGYKFAESLPKGEVLEDIAKKKWKLGASVGQGGFGDIYAAQEASSTGSTYPYVIKIEPHTNGPLFVEMHFYMRNAKPADIEEFKKEKSLKTFGMPAYLGSGSHEFKGEKYRFVVMEKFGTDLWKLFLENNKSFPPQTVFKLAIQILDILEYIHNRGYVHADIKGANILMGVTKATSNQAYLVDFGLATKFTTEKSFKPNPKKAHDGTIEYLSRDAHKGVQTRRGDLEILAYNLIQWLGCTLPWESDLKDVNAVHKAKEEYMESVPKMIKACFGHKSPPGAIVDFLNYLKTLKFDTEPDYKKIRKIFQSGIKDAGGSEKGPLVFSMSKKTPQKRKSDTGLNQSPKRKVRKGRTVKKAVEEEIENLEENDDKEASNSESSSQKIAQSDLDDEDIIEPSFEETPVEKKELKEKANKSSNKKRVNSKKTNDSDAKKNKPAQKKETDADQTEAADPYEGYTDAMKEVMKRKLQNGKSKGRKAKPPAESENTEGYNEGMKEIVEKKKDRLVKKKAVKAKKGPAPAATVQTGDDAAMGSRSLRTRKEVCYAQTDSD